MLRDRKRINPDWECKIETFSQKELFDSSCSTTVRVVLTNNKTGEIRSKEVSLDFLARRVFQYEMKTWQKDLREPWLEKVR